MIKALKEHMHIALASSKPVVCAAGLTAECVCLWPLHILVAVCHMHEADQHDCLSCSTHDQLPVRITFGAQCLPDYDVQVQGSSL